MRSALDPSDEESLIVFANSEGLVQCRLATEYRQAKQEGPLMKTYIVDSFTDQAFKGNPAGVCISSSPLLAESMLAIAKELNFSETAFVVPREEPNHFSIRYFSPIMEIPLCGHATLASSKVLFHQDQRRLAIQFTTAHDLGLKIEKVGTQIVMEFPVYDVQEASVPVELLNAIGVSETVNCVYNKETNIILLEIESADLLARLAPDFNALKASYDGIHGLLVTAKSDDSEFDFHSRFFWPWSGGQEDPATGGTHTFLAKYWAERLGKKKLRSFQCSARTGSMEVELTDDNKLLIRAQAVILFEGNWVGDC